ncbi:unnamed protein product (macronuclear) [Paramecium tetraurelia]|uniref:Uncharacterized protein n=1 Tax=Paramecium tetraurelia TaxID=5888 RepID=A0BFC0_PARTE|nr:uncharacterized protein GSPATT00028272001 [Paramecium tetraurelia]CAK57237.1 unnamed protein product [Paramecium tetraurelia]|eukprot:XP_001424635.1 hypothetical protein (macronuclear) [Paramecium tetraurelia strain d4-2]
MSRNIGKILLSNKLLQRKVHLAWRQARIVTMQIIEITNLQKSSNMLEGMHANIALLMQTLQVAQIIYVKIFQKQNIVLLNQMVLFAL